MTQFERCHGNGEALKVYNELLPYFTTEFKRLMLEVLINKYLYHEMDYPLISDSQYDDLYSEWHLMGERLGVMSQYPYTGDFPSAHPMAQEAAIEGKRRLGISNVK